MYWNLKKANLLSHTHTHTFFCTVFSVCAHTDLCVRGRVNVHVLKWRITCWFWSRGKICFAKRRWTLPEPWLMFRCYSLFSLSTHKLQKTHIANTSQYSLHSCLITDDWFGSEDERERELKERTHWQTHRGRRKKRKPVALYHSYFLFTAVRKGLGLLHRYPSRYYWCSGEKEKGVKHWWLHCVFPHHNHPDYKVEFLTSPQFQQFCDLRWKTFSFLSERQACKDNTNFGDTHIRAHNKLAEKQLYDNHINQVATNLALTGFKYCSTWSECTVQLYV